MIAVLLIGLAIVALLAAAIGAFLRWPFETHHLVRRAVLAASGAQRRALAGPRGQLVYWTAGSGPPLVLLHGAGDRAGSWARMPRALGSRHRLLIPDLPGHGASAPASGTLDLGDMLAGLEALLAREAPEGRVVLVGNSMGGWVALLFARRHPERVARLVLEDSGGVRGDEPPPSLVPRNLEEARRLLKASRGPDSADPPRFLLAALIRIARRGPLARIAQSDPEPYLLDGQLSDLGAPVDLIWGEHDGLLPLGYARRLAAELPGSKLHVIPRCGHVPHLERPRELLALLARILAEPAAKDEAPVPAGG